MRPHHLLLYSLFLAPLILSCGSSSRETEEGILSHLHEVAKLELIEQRSEEVIMISGSGESLNTISSLEDAMTYLDDLLRVGQRVGVYSFGHYAVAYIDLSQLSIEDISLSSKGKKVTLTLPSVQVEPIGRSGEIKLLHERVTGTRRPITSEERSQVQAKATEQARERIKPGSPNHTALVQQAKEQAIAYFTGLFRSKGYEEISIHFRLQFYTPSP